MLKKSFKIFALIFSIAIFTISCNEKVNEIEDKNQLNVEFNEEEIKDIKNITSYLSSYHNPTKGPWEKIKAWILAHSGSDPIGNNCTGNHACGPCAGICFTIWSTGSIVEEDYQQTQQDIQDGKSVINIVKIEDNTNKIIISFDIPSDFVYNENLYVPEDTDLGNDIADEFNRTSLILKKGVYPICYQFNDKGETVIDLK